MKKNKKTSQSQEGRTRYNEYKYRSAKRLFSYQRIPYPSIAADGDGGYDGDDAYGYKLSYSRNYGAKLRNLFKITIFFLKIFRFLQFLDIKKVKNSYNHIIQFIIVPYDNTLKIGNSARYFHKESNGKQIQCKNNQFASKNKISIRGKFLGINFGKLQIIANFVGRTRNYLRMGKIRETSAKISNFYIEGFKSMTIGKALWALIILKLILLFLVLKLFFFPDVLKENYDTDAERAEAVRTALTD